MSLTHQYFSSLFHCVKPHLLYFRTVATVTTIWIGKFIGHGRVTSTHPKSENPLQKGKDWVSMGPNETAHIFVAYIKYSSPQLHSSHSTCVVILLSALFYKLLKNWLTCVIPLNVRWDIFKDPNVTFHTPLTPSSTCSYKHAYITYQLNTQLISWSAQITIASNFRRHFKPSLLPACTLS